MTEPVRLLLMPSAKLVPIELQTEFGRIPSAMVPLGGHPAFTLIAKPYLEKGWRVLIAANEQHSAIEDYLRNASPAGVDLVDVGPTRSLADTVLAALGSLSALPDELVINFADTLLGDEMAPGTAIAIGESRNLYRWTCLVPAADGRIDRILERFEPKDTALPAVAGVFRIRDVVEFVDDLKAARRETEGGVDPFYAAFKVHFNRRRPAERILQRVELWWDLGHLDTYYHTKQTYWINKRFFNELAIHRGRGLIRKESRDAKKFINEIRWYLRLPKQLAYLSPRLFDWSLDAFNPWVEMEFYGYPALNDMYLFGHHDQGVWVQVLDAIAEALEAMAEYRLEPADPQDAVAAMREMYETKTAERLTPLAQDSWTAPFFAETLSVNGRTCPGIPPMLRALPRVAAAAGLYYPRPFTIVHGDLCLSNILYDPRNGAIRVIDPRGSFGQWDIYGDPRYDLAKLSHSIEGDYDLIVNGMVTCDWTNGNFCFRPHLTARHEAVKRVFRPWLAARAGADGEAVGLIESLLFLSMAPLHADRPDSQRAFLCNGLLRFQDVASRLGETI